jgi:hypothetical protein
MAFKMSSQAATNAAFCLANRNRNRKVTFIVRLLLEDRRGITIKLKYKKTDTVKYS